MTQKSYTLAQLAEFLGCEFEGDAEIAVTGLATLERAQTHQITFLAQAKYSRFLPDCKAGILVARKAQADDFTGAKLHVEDPYLAYAKLSSLFDTRKKTPEGVHPTALVASTATLAEGVCIGPGVVIGDGANIGLNTEICAGVVIAENVTVGADCLLYPNVNIYAEVRIGDRVTIHSGTVIGSDGFGFAPSAEGWIKIHQLGSVNIGSDVEIGANTCIDRGALTDTIIEDGVIIDNLVHIAHGVVIGQQSALAGCVGIAGSTKIGKRCTLGGMVGVSGHLEIADDSHFHGGTTVIKNIKEPGAYASAIPVMDVKKWRRSSVRFTQLDDMAARIQALEKSNKE